MENYAVKWLLELTPWVFLFFFFFGRAVQHLGSWFPGQGSILWSPELGVWSLNHCTAWEVPRVGYLLNKF